MEISTEINKKKNIRSHIVIGAVHISELTEYLKVIYNTPDLDTEMNVFWDLRKADFSSISSEEVRSFMGFVSKQWGTGGKSKAALVVSSDFEFGMSRMYQIMMDGATSSDIAIFRNVDEANEWIEAGT